MKKKISLSIEDEMYYVGFRLQIGVVDYFDRIAAKQLRTRSEVLRTTLIEALKDKGVVVIDDEDEAP